MKAERGSKADIGSSNLVHLRSLGVNGEARRLRRRDNWLMDTTYSDADTTIARVLNEVGYNLDIQRQVRDRPKDDDRVMLFAKDERSRKAFWEVANVPQLVELSVPLPKETKTRKERATPSRNEVLEMVTGVVYKLTSKKAS